MKKEQELEIEQEDSELTEADIERQRLIDSFNADDFALGNGTYRVILDYREGFDYGKVLDRYQEILAKYDYIVGDWGYDQLRLKGFFKDDFKNAAIDAKISHLDDYLYEYCNFGCAYFIIEQTGEFQRKGRDTSGHASNKKNRNKKNNAKQQAHVKEKKIEKNNNRKKDKFKKADKQVKVKQDSNNKQLKNPRKDKARTFTIRQKER
ncbi:YutD family protein [Vagococcus vulneris]|uniref:Transcriptional regulator n=1 Tax=Vagococcus vulneris TaxID=1977869 RepID=A0A429ZWQ2_9ENTE|nr:YutD family protein [Vagococcus vulneris]RST98232.1 hypothetical protein CBF37_08675 [Vagococcus vulneris]